MQQMKRRPAPLSDEVLAAPGASGGYPGGPVLLGHAGHGLALKVKNTFLEVPSATPVSMKHAVREPQLTAPASLNKSCLLVAAALRAQDESAEWPEANTPEAGPSLFAATPRSSLGATPPATPPPPLPPPSAPWRSSEALATAGYASLPAGPSTYSLAPGSFKASPGLLQGGAAAEESGEESDSGSEDGAQAQPLTRPDVAAAPKPPPGALHPSVGSELHGLGTCKRCCFFSRGRCLNGYACEFCHYEHDKRKRKNKKQRTKMGFPTAGRGGMRRERPGLSALLGGMRGREAHAGVLAARQARGGMVAAATSSMLVPSCCEAAPGHQLILYHTAPQALSFQYHQAAPQELLLAHQVLLPSACAQAAQAQQQQCLAQAAVCLTPHVPRERPMPMLQQAGGGHCAPPPPPTQSPRLRQLFVAPL